MKTKTPVLPNLCQFPFADGRRCRMPRSRDHGYLCVFHADRERRLYAQQALDSGDISDLFGPSGELRTNTDVNAYLTRIAKHAVSGRISPEILPSLVYTGALLLRTLSAVQLEYAKIYSYEAWADELRRIYSARESPKNAYPNPPANS